MSIANTYQTHLELAGIKPVQAYHIAQVLTQAAKRFERKPIDMTIERAVGEVKTTKMIEAIKKVGQMAEQDRVEGIVQKLIEAVQTAKPEKLREVIQWTQKLIAEEQRDLDAKLASVRKQAGNKDGEMVSAKVGCSRKTYVDDGLSSCLGMTALHVACGNYVLHTQYRKQFNEMIKDLLDAGANPCRAVGRKVAKKNGFLVEVDPGMTVAQVCKGNMPPALLEYFAREVTEPVVNHWAANQRIDKRSVRIRDGYECSVEELDEYFTAAA